MNSFKYSAIALAIASIASLSACGGGGSSPTPPPPASCTNNATNPPACDNQPKDAAGTVAVIPTDSAPAVKREIANLTLTVTPTATSGSVLSVEVLGYSCNGLSIVADLSKGTLSSSKVLTLVPTTLPAYGDTCVAQGTATFAGTNGGKQATVSWKTTFTVEQAPKLTYTDKVYALYTTGVDTNGGLGNFGKYPHLVTKTSVVPAKNMTPYKGGGFDLLNCLIANYALTDGKILTLCKDGVEGKYRLLYTNPVENAVYVYTGTVPANLAYTLSADSKSVTVPTDTSWGDVGKFDPAHPTWGVSTKTAEGWFFAKIGEGWVLRFQDNSGAEVSVSDQGAAKPVYLLTTYNN